MTYKVLLHLKAVRFLRRVDLSIRDQIRQRLKELEESPKNKGERLKNSMFWRLRVGDYRVIYEIDDEKNMVIILFIGHRRDVYDDFTRILE